MSVPASLARRQAIEQAQRTARAALEQFREAEVEALDELSDALAERIAEHVAQVAGADGRVPPEALPLLEALIRASLVEFGQQWPPRLSAALRRAAQIAAGITASGAESAALVTRVDAYLQAFRAADGLALSDRVWRVGRVLEDDVLTTLRTAVGLGYSAQQTADQLLATGQPVPAGLAAQARSAESAAIAERIRDAITGEGGSARFVLDRLIRTEINRAFTETFVDGLHDVDGVAGVKFTLSPLHPRPDVCDLHARANLHGLGPGVYPLGNHPYPAHPQTLSFLVPVFVDEVSDDDRAGQQDVFAFLREQPPELQDAILGGARKGNAFRAGLLQPDELRLPWYLIAERLGVTE